MRVCVRSSREKYRRCDDVSLVLPIISPDPYLAENKGG